MGKHAFAKAICLLTLLVVFFSGCGKLSEWEQHAIDYVTGTHQPVQSFADDGNYTELEPLRDLAEQNTVLLFGETPHGLVDNYQIELKLLKFLHGLGYRYLLIEPGFDSAEVLSEYLSTGSDHLLLGMQGWQAPVANNNAEALQFWRDVCAWNQSLPESERVTVWAVDVAHMTRDASTYITRLINRLPDVRARERISGLYLKTKQTYPAMKSFEAELLKETSQLRDPEVTKLRLAVRALKDLLASTHTAMQKTGP